MRKKILSVFMALAIISTLFTGAFALDAPEESPAATPESCANTLYALGLMQGTGRNEDGTPIFELNRSLKRDEAITMLVRLLGAEDAALSETHTTPFTDVEDWAKPYVGYAYAMGYTNGDGPSTFGGNEDVTASQYITFVLRALGYTSGKDFAWDSAWTLSDPLGLTSGEYGIDTVFLRGNVALISMNALSQTKKGSAATLLSSLLENGAVTQDAITAAGLTSLLTEKVMDTSEISAKSSGAVFIITSYDKAGSELKSGNGFFINESGVAVTNYSLIKDASSATITTTKGKSFKVLGIFDFDESKDLAIIQVEGEGFDALTLETAALTGNETVFSLFFPRSGVSTIEKGSVTAASEEVGGVSYVKSSVEVPEASSGAPLLNAYGRIVGVYSSKNGLNLSLSCAAINSLSREGYRMFSKEAGYKDFTAVPDFGAYLGFEGTGSSSGNGGLFLYDKANIDNFVPNALDQYKELLEKWGFEYHGTFTGPETSGMLYLSKDLGTTIYFGTVTDGTTTLYSVMVLSLKLPL